jgi:3-methyladenine DNA glycosylase/8-oxoguanine DNA glycosylase
LPIAFAQVYGSQDLEGEAMELNLPARHPFLLSAVLRSHGWVRLAPFETDGDFQRLLRVECLDSGRVVALAVSPFERGVCIAVDEDLSEEEREEVARKVQWMLALNLDLSDFYALARQEPKLTQVEERAQGRILRCPTLFEDTVKTILTTNTAWGGTIRMVNSLVNSFGTPLASDTDRHAFPTPEQLASLDEATLRAEGGLGYRAPYVLQLAREVASGERNLEALKDDSLPTETVRSDLLAIKGVGDYAVANLLMLLGRYEYLPVDSWALKMASHEWFDGQPVSRADVEASFANWGPWQGLAYWLWDWTYLERD